MYLGSTNAATHGTTCSTNINFSLISITSIAGAAIGYFASEKKHKLKGVLVGAGIGILSNTILNFSHKCV